MQTFKIVLGGLFVLLTVAICVLGVLAYKSNQTANETSHAVEHSLQILEETELIASSFKAIQLESNALFIKQDSSFYKPYDDAKSALKASINDLISLTSGNTAQAKNVESLDEQLQGLINYSDSAIRTSQHMLTTESFVARIDQSAVQRSEIQETLRRIRDSEKALLVLVRSENRENLNTFKVFFLSLLLGIFILVGSTFISTRYHFNKLVKADKKLIKANELFFKLFYEAPVAFVISRPEDGIIVDCNEVYASLVNYTREELLNKNAVDLRIINPGGTGNEVIRSLRASGSLKNVETCIHPRGKDEIWTMVSIQLIHLEDRDYLLSALIDVSSHKKAEDDIRTALEKQLELNEMKSNFVSLASHEFRTPLTTITSSASLLENYIDGERKANAMRHIGRIKSAVVTLTSILEEFLSLTKIEEGRTKCKPEEINVEELVASVANSLKTSVKAGQVVSYSHEGPEIVYSDPMLLTNVVTNLLSNAIKYSPENAPIILSSKVNHTVTIKVEDHGVGIPEADQAHLFERFYRASNAGNVQGTGLGLHITRHHVELLGGSIEVSSVPGSGTTFTVKLPTDPN